MCFICSQVQSLGPSADTRILRAQLSNPESSGSATIADFSAQHSAIADAIKQFHRRIPKARMATWLENMQSFLAQDCGGHIPLGSGCSGSDVWIHCLTSLA